METGCNQQLDEIGPAGAAVPHDWAALWLCELLVVYKTNLTAFSTVTWRKTSLSKGPNFHKIVYVQCLKQEHVYNSLSRLKFTSVAEKANLPLLKSIQSFS